MNFLFEAPVVLKTPAYEDDKDDSDGGDCAEHHELRVLQQGSVLSVGVEVMAHVLSFLTPSDALELLASPVCRDWQENFTHQPELWRIMCLQDPFRAQVEDETDDDRSVESDDDSIDMEKEIKRTFGKHRVMFSRLVRCQTYITQIKGDALAGRPPSVIEYVKNDKTLGDLQRFLARATRNSRKRSTPYSIPPTASAQALPEPISLADDGRSRKRAAQEDNKDAKRPRLGASAITQRLLSKMEALSAVDPAKASLPWSCAIYAIVNWMAAYEHVPGVQTICLDALPYLMEDEEQRFVAQRAGLTDLVLLAMVRFPDSAKLQTAALHTLVLLGRPLGGREGQLFSLSMTNASSSFGGQLSGIEVILSSMKRFIGDATLQATGCWSLVNLALDPAQKQLLIQLGGASTILAAMAAHPLSTDVQFRSLFSLINLVIPSPDATMGWLNPVVDRMVELVVTSMKNFCSNMTILNRACLVLHNISLTHDLNSSLLLDADCFHLLEWCIASYPSDNILQKAAVITLHRLQTTLSGDDRIRARFAARRAERRSVLESMLLPEDELWFSDSDDGSDEDEED